ncbi:hypothetical protein DVQ89_22575 [Yersinia enterocolitica]|nr:hypothetical protein [Yersinia enterocolitica]
MTNVTKNGKQQEQETKDTDFPIIVSCDCPGGFYAGKMEDRVGDGTYCTHCGQRLTVLQGAAELEQWGAAHE